MQGQQPRGSFATLEHQKLRRTLTDVTQFLHQHKIEFWLGMGSLLGAFRNNGTIISWDTDADLYISEDDEQRYPSPTLPADRASFSLHDALPLCPVYHTPALRAPTLLHQAARCPDQ